MKNGSFLQDSRCVVQYAEVPSVDAYETTTATDTTDDDDETALGNCLDEDNIVIVQLMIYLHICTLYGGRFKEGLR
jgi:hypothetical protein